jgi:phosphatidylglycerol---prolipoprotein diacylglyceryl transferase
VLAVVPIAWIFGRMGCSVVHDHPGLRAPAWMPLSVAYGPGRADSFGFFELRYGSVPRYDLGLLEMLFAVCISVVFAATWKKRLRFGLDFLRLDDPEGGDLRYGSLTPAQWACLALFLMGLVIYARMDRAIPVDSLAEPAS